MKYSPETGGRRVVLPSVLLLVASAVCILIPSIPGARDLMPATIIQFVGLILAVVGIYILVRFRFVSFTYCLALRERGAGEDEEAYEDETDVTRIPPSLLDFTVVKGRGSRPAVTECVLSVGDLCEVLSYENRRGLSTELRREKGVAAYYDYTVSLKPGEVTVLIFDTRDGKVAVAVECGDEMKSALAALAGKGGDDTP